MTLGSIVPDLLKMYRSSLKNSPWFWFGLKFFVSILLLRLAYGYNHLIFSQDQARDAFLMKQYAEQGRIFIAYGAKTSVSNFFAPPFYYQIHYWFSVLFRHPPLIMQWVITVMESLTPVILFFWLKMLVRPRTAFWASVTYALCIFPTTFATFAWNPNLIPFFSTLAGYCWFRVLLYKERWPILVGCIATVIAGHLHYQSIVLIPFAFIVFLYDIWRKPIHIWHWILGGILGLSTLLPYVLTESQTNWPNTRLIFEFFTQEHSLYFDRVSKFHFVFTFIPSFIETVIWNLEFPFVIFGRLFLFITGTIMALVALRRPRWRWVVLYFVCIVVMLRVYKGDKLEYYLSTMYILPAFLLAASWQVGRRVIVIGILILAAWAGFSVSNKPTTHALRNLTTAVEFINQHTDPQEPFGLHFHNSNVINVFSYEMSGNQEFALATGSTTLVEICDNKTPCVWNGVRECAYTRGYTYSVLLKDRAGYTLNEQLSVEKQYRITVGTLTTPISEVGYPLHPDSQAFGSDLLLPGIYTR